jgi:hypothetical protein
MDGINMPTGLGFAVRIDPSALVYCTSSFPATYTEVLVSHPMANSNYWATILVTPIGGAARPVSVKHSPPYWRIVYSDGGPIPPSTCFNVKVIAFSQYLDNPISGDWSGLANVTADWGTGIDLGGNGSGHTSGAFRNLLFDWAQNTLTRPVFTTYNQTPLGLAPFVDARFFGVNSSSRFIAGPWSVYHEDDTAMPLNAHFNVWAPCAGSAWYPDADGDGWGGPGTVQGSCMPVTGHATRGGDCNDGNGTVYPNAFEVNDGEDNQCLGEPGHGVIDEVSGTTFFYDRTTLCWPQQPGASSYRVSRSPHPTFVPCAYTSTTSTCLLNESALPAPGQVFFYLIRADGPHQGSWGTDAEGEERVLSCS